MSKDATCGCEWEDGWGNHECFRSVNHDGDHLCDCDARLTNHRENTYPVKDAPMVSESD